MYWKRLVWVTSHMSLFLVLVHGWLGFSPVVPQRHLVTGTACINNSDLRPLALFGRYRTMLCSIAEQSKLLEDSSSSDHHHHHADTWSQLLERLLQTNVGRRLEEEHLKQQQQQQLLGQNLRDDKNDNVDATFRLFDAQDQSEIRVTLYRDAAGWCPYCQKVWILLEEKRIPYRMKKAPLNAYGDKPAWYTRMVDGGKLPALDLDGILYTESGVIMDLLLSTFCCGQDNNDNGGEQDGQKTYQKDLMDLENDLQRDWFSLVFYPIEGKERLQQAQNNLLATLQKVDKALGKTAGPWFLGTGTPTIIDIHYISGVERMVAAVFFWRGVQLRGLKELPNFERWLAAWEERPAYLATKADYYSLVKAIPSQNGPGYFSEDAKPIANQLCGLDGAWDLTKIRRDPMRLLEPLAPSQVQGGSVGARHEAAYKLIKNHDAIVRFAARGAGEPGRPSFHAELADPYAQPNENFFDSVDLCLRHVAGALLSDDIQDEKARLDLAGKAGDGSLREEWEEYQDDDGNVYYWNYVTGDSTWTAPTMQLDTCLTYLRDRIGVPRDMGAAAAFQFRAHLNWVIDILNTKTD